jgi:hypothetical protein
MARTTIHGRQVTDGSIESVDLSTDLNNTINGKADSSSLATVATTGDYTDLSNTPSIPSALDELSDVVITSATTDQILKYDGSNWINDAAPAAGASSLDELSDVTLTSSASGEFLKYDGSAWINSTLPEANASQSGVVTTAAQTIAGEKTFTASVLNVGPQISGSSAYISVKYNYTQMYFGFVPGYGATAGTQQAGTPFILRSAFVEGLRLEGSNNVDVPRVGINNSAPTAQLDIIARSASTKGLIVKAAASQTANLLEVQNSSGTALFTIDKDGSVAAGTVPAARVTGLATVATSGDYTDLSNTPSIPSALDDLSDVVITSATTDQILKYDGSNWINDTAPAAGASSLDELSDVTITSAESNQFLKYDGSAWINSALPEAGDSTTGVITTSTQTIAGSKTFTSRPWVKTSGPYIGFEETNPSYRGFAISTFANTMLISRTAINSQTFENKNGQWGFSHNLETYKTGINNISPDAQLHVNAADSSYKGLIVKGAASQTANLFEVQNSAGTVLSSISSAGAAYFASNITAVGTLTFGIAGSGMALKNGGYNGVSLGRSSSAGESGLALGSYVSCGSNAMVIGWGGGGTGRQIIGLSTGEVGIGTATPGAQLHLIPKATTMKGLIVQGLASQTANLLEVQDSTGTALFTIDKDGSVAAGTVPAARITGLATVATTGSYTDLTNTPTGLATETYVDTAISNLVNSAPATLDTLNELAAALGDDPNFATTVAGQIGDLDTRIDALEDNAFITAEAPTGLIDGSNTIFTLANTPVAGSEQVYLNGLLQASGVGNDYTISGSTITLASAPNSGSRVLVSYATGTYSVAPAEPSSEGVTNSFDTALTPSSGVLTLDVNQGTIVLGDLDSSVTEWAITNVSTENGKATTITVIITGDSTKTYGDACSVNGTSITNGVKWVGGSAPSASDGIDVISLTIIKDNSGTIQVLGGATLNFS